MDDVINRINQEDPGSGIEVAYLENKINTISNAPKTTQPQSKTQTQTETQTYTKEQSNTAKTTTWTANDYKPGDIQGNSYTVVSGDTLWEISEAVYGTGTQWHKIADANGVSYLSNGNPLILPGQTLTIP